MQYHINFDIGSISLLSGLNVYFMNLMNKFFSTSTLKLMFASYFLQFKILDMEDLMHCSRLKKSILILILFLTIIVKIDFPNKLQYL